MVKITASDLQEEITYQCKTYLQIFVWRRGLSINTVKIQIYTYLNCSLWKPGSSNHYSLLKVEAIASNNNHTNDNSAYQPRKNYNHSLCCNLLQVTDIYIYVYILICTFQESNTKHNTNHFAKSLSTKHEVLQCVPSQPNFVYHYK